MTDLDWKVRMDEAFNEGLKAGSWFDNPYWTSYPREASTEEECMARHWVDGYVEKMKGSYATTP